MVPVFFLTLVLVVWLVFRFSGRSPLLTHQPKRLDDHWHDGPRYFGGRLVAVRRRERPGHEHRYAFTFSLELDRNHPLPNLDLARSALDAEDAERASLLSDVDVQELVERLPTDPELRGNVLWLEVTESDSNPEGLTDLGQRLAELAAHLDELAPHSAPERLLRGVQRPGQEQHRLTCLRLLHRFAPTAHETTRATQDGLASGNARLALTAAHLLNDEPVAAPYLLKLAPSAIPDDLQPRYWRHLAGALPAEPFHQALKSALADPRWRPQALILELLEQRVLPAPRDELVVALLGHPNTQPALELEAFRCVTRWLEVPAAKEVAVSLLSLSQPELGRAALDWLDARATPDERVASLRIALRNPGLRGRACAIIEAERLSEFVVELANRLSVSRESAEALVLTHTLGALADPSAEPALLAELALEDEPRIVAACRALAHLGTPLGATRLRSLLAASPTKPVREAAEEALGELTRYQADAVARFERERLLGDHGDAALRRLLDDVRAPYSVRSAAFDELLESPSPPSVELFRNLVASESPDDRRLAALGLAHHRDRASVAALLTALQGAEGHAELEADLAVALGVLADPSAEQALLALLDRPHAPVRLAALGALSEAGGATAVRALERIASNRLAGGDRTAARAALERIRERHALGGLSLATRPETGGELSLAGGGEVAVLPPDDD